MSLSGPTYLGTAFAYIPGQGETCVSMYSDENGEIYWENPLDCCSWDSSYEDASYAAEQADWDSYIAGNNAAVEQQIAADNAAAFQKASDIVASGKPVQINYDDGTTTVILPDGKTATFDNPGHVSVVVPVYADGFKFDGIGLSQSAVNILNDPARKITSYAQAESQAGIDATFAQTAHSLAGANIDLFDLWLKRDMAWGDYGDPSLIQTYVDWGDLTLPTGGWLMWSPEMGTWVAPGGDGTVADFSFGALYGISGEAFSQIEGINQVINSSNPLASYGYGFLLNEAESVALDGYAFAGDWAGANFESSSFAYGKVSGGVFVIVVGTLLTDGGSAAESGAMFSKNLGSAGPRASGELLDAMRAHGRTITIATEGTEELRFLNAMGAEASVGGPQRLSILLRENPSQAAAIEEFLHGTQTRLGIVDRLGLQGAEAHVESFMTRYSKLLGLEPK